MTNEESSNGSQVLDFQLLQGKLEQQATEKENLENIAQRILRVVIATGGLLLSAGGITFSGNLPFDLPFSLSNVVGLVEKTAYDYPPVTPTLANVVIFLTVLGVFSVFAYSIYKIFFDFVSKSVKVISPQNFRTGPKALDFEKGGMLTTEDEKNYDTLAPEYHLSIRYNEEILEDKRTALSTGLDSLRQGIWAAVLGVGIAVPPLAFQSPQLVLFSAVSSAMFILALIASGLSELNLSEYILWNKIGDIPLIGFSLCSLFLLILDGLSQLLALLYISLFFILMYSPVFTGPLLYYYTDIDYFERYIFRNILITAGIALLFVSVAVVEQNTILQLVSDEFGRNGNAPLTQGLGLILVGWFVAVFIYCAVYGIARGKAMISEGEIFDRIRHRLQG